MSNQRGIIAYTREFFTLDGAERAARAQTPAQHRRLAAYARAGARRLSAARRIASAAAAAPLLREAVICYLGAVASAAEGRLDLDTIGSEDLARAMPEVPPDPTRPNAAAADDARVRAALAARDVLYFDRLSPEEVARTVAALERAASMLRGRVEARSITNIRGTRRGRAMALVVVAAYAASTGVRAVILPRNIALHKPVEPSSVKATPAHGQTIVDGELGWSYGVHTDTDDSPSVTIDLIDAYRVDWVHVHNRVDGWFDDCLPLVVELSTDGRKFEEIERRDRHFDAEPPWVVRAHGKPARYVRVRVAHRGYLALSEVEVFGKKI